MVAILVFGIVAIPMDRASGGSTLEIPSAAPSSAPAPMPASTPVSDPAPYTDNTPLPGMGTASDYMHQSGDPGAARSGYPASGNAYAYNAPADPQSNSPDLVTAALVGGAIIGLIALSNYAAAHHHHHR